MKHHPRVVVGGRRRRALWCTIIDDMMTNAAAGPDVQISFRSQLTFHDDQFIALGQHIIFNKLEVYVPELGILGRRAGHSVCKHARWGACP